MPNFKPKASKKIKVYNNISNTSLDSKHQEKMNEFKHNEDIIIPKINDDIKLLKKSLKKIKKNIKNGNTSNNINKLLNIKDTIKLKKKELKNYKNSKKDYLLRNSKYIHSYFEKKKEISQDNKKKTVLHSFFNKKTNKNINNISKNDEATDIENYLKNIDNDYLDINKYKVDYNICKLNNCNGELIPVDYDGLLICNKCFNQITYLIEHEKPSYKEPPKEVCFYAYKRINHFREILAQFQAKETTQIPEQVLIDIENQIKKERISLSEFTNSKAKDILKKLGYNKYYEHIPFIKDKLGIKPPIMSPELEDKLCNLFLEIQKPYSKHCPQDRVNFLNYYYVLYKMCELLNENTFLSYFPMLKDPIKRIEQDEIWKKICNELNWEFYSTK